MNMGFKSSNANSIFGVINICFKFTILSYDYVKSKTLSFFTVMTESGSEIYWNLNTDNHKPIWIPELIKILQTIQQKRRCHTNILSYQKISQSWGFFLNIQNMYRQ